MQKEDIMPRIPLDRLIPAWSDLSPARQAEILVQINQEWWMGYYSGMRAGIRQSADCIDPLNEPHDWTEYAKIRHEAAANIRKLISQDENAG